MKHYIGAGNPMRAQFEPKAAYKAEHFAWSFEAGVGTITLNRPDRKNPLTFDSYGELRDLFRALVYATDVKAIVVTGAGGNFCSGGDVHEIIGPLTGMRMPELLEFTRMTGELVKAMRACPQPIVGAIDGVCAGAGAMIALRMWQGRGPEVIPMLQTMEGGPLPITSVIVSMMLRAGLEDEAAAYYAGSLPNAKKPPALKELLIPKRKPRGVKQDWREIKAAFQVALPRETPRITDGKKQRDRRPARRPRAQ